MLTRLLVTVVPPPVEVGEILFRVIAIMGG